MDTVMAPSVDTQTATGDWDAIVRTHTAQVYRHAYRLTRNRADADDLVQDVFVRVFRSLGTYTPGSFEGWLHRITLNLFLDRIRQGTRLRVIALPAYLQEHLAEHAPSAAEAMEQAGFEPDVEQALHALPPCHLAAVLLRDIDGFSYDEIAGALGVQRGTVGSRLHRGRRQLRSALAHRAPRTSVSSTAPSTVATDTEPPAQAFPNGQTVDPDTVAKS
jgi:RNA polymerase sigma factor (sigma-70 family)